MFHEAMLKELIFIPHSLFLMAKAVRLIQTQMCGVLPTSVYPIKMNEWLLHQLRDLLLTALSQFWPPVSCMYFPSLMRLERRPIGGLQVVESARHLQTGNTAALWDLDMKGFMRRKCSVNLRGSEWPSSYFCVHGGWDWLVRRGLGAVGKNMESSSRP